MTLFERYSPAVTTVMLGIAIVDLVQGYWYLAVMAFTAAALFMFVALMSGGRERVPKPPPRDREVSTVLGPYYAYRAFKLAGTNMLVSTAMSHVYKPGWNYARTYRPWQKGKIPRTSDDWDRLFGGDNSGFWTCWTISLVRAQSGVLTGPFALVELKGLVHEHELGARGEYLRILALKSLENRKELRERYQVPVFLTNWGLRRFHKSLTRKRVG